MNEYNYKIAELDYLNEIDIWPYICLAKNHSVQITMKLIKKHFEKGFLLRNPDCMGLFYNLTEQEFIDYINSRYGLQIREEVVYYFNI